MSFGRNIGPAGKDADVCLWDRFLHACDEVFNAARREWERRQTEYLAKKAEAERSMRNGSGNSANGAATCGAKMISTMSKQNFVAKRCGLKGYPNPPGEHFRRVGFGWMSYVRRMLAFQVTTAASIVFSVI